MTGLYLQQVIMIALLSIKRFRWAPLGLVAIAATIIAHHNISQVFERPWNVLSLRDAVDLDERYACSLHAALRCCPCIPNPILMHMYYTSQWLR